VVYAKHFPDGLLVGWINFNEFKSKLAKHSQRTKEELWETSSVSKLAKTILYFIEGSKMTPPLVRHDKDHCLTIGGGFHRIGVCLARDEKIIPILVVPSEKEAIQNILPSEKPRPKLHRTNRSNECRLLKQIVHFLKFSL